MEENISVRLPREELKEIETILNYRKLTKSAALREILAAGIKNELLNIAMEKFRKNEATAWKAAKIARIPLTVFIDKIKEYGLEFHYSEEDLEEDFKDL